MSKTKNDPIFTSMINKLREVTVVSPQNLGIFTPVYKTTTALLKQNPWKILVPVSLLLAFMALRITGIISIKTVSVLQSGF